MALRIGGRQGLNKLLIAVIIVIALLVLVKPLLGGISEENFDWAEAVDELEGNYSSFFVVLLSGAIIYVVFRLLTGAGTMS